MKLMRKNGGFTLVELIVVIAILAILAGIAVPAYSGYIKKADKAADLQLLAAVNESFQAACVSEGTTAAAIKSASLTWNGAKVVGISSPAELDSAFKMFYAGNEGTEFKVLANKLVFANGVFAEMGSGLANVMDALLGDTTLSASIQAVKDSAFHTIGYDKLAGQIDNASGMMAELGADETSSFYNLLNSAANQETMLSFFGSEEEVMALGLQKVEMLKKDPAYAGKTDEELSAIAMNQMLANTAVLTAAQNSTAVNDTFISNLANGSAIDALRATTDGGEATADTVAQAAFAYAMYTSYKNSKGEDVSGEVNLLDVYNTLESDDFKNNYMTSAQFTADKDGYMGAMDLISAGANNSDGNVANDILLNGFNSSELVALMQGLTK